MHIYIYISIYLSSKSKPSGLHPTTSSFVLYDGIPRKALSGGYPLKLIMEEIDKLKSLATRLVRPCHWGSRFPGTAGTAGTAGWWKLGTLRIILQSSDCLSTTQIPEAWLDSRAASCWWHVTGMAMAIHQYRLGDGRMCRVQGPPMFHGNIR